MTHQRARLTLLERLLYGTALATSLTVALAWSPFWQALGPITRMLPPAQAVLLESLPGHPNTALAFLVLLGIILIALFLLRDAMPVLGILTALALGTAAFPYGQVLWHRLIDLPLVDARPTVGAWIRGLVPVLLLLVPPTVTHLRAVSAAYKEKQVDDAERLRVLRHLARSSLATVGIATGIALLLGALLSVAARVVATELRFLGRNSALVLLIAAVLIVFGLGIGTGLFSRTKEENDQDPTGGRPARLED